MRRLRERIIVALAEAWCEVGGPDRMGALPLDPKALCDTLLEDAIAFANNDPASGGNPLLVVDAYVSFIAVVHYRLAHALLVDERHGAARNVVARRLAERGKLLSGTDIHPAATIGARLVLDHAVGTVIGETCLIGDDAYILGGVTLGALGVAGNPRGKRHPTLGDRVRIGAGVRILGPVTIGSDVFVCPGAVVTTDIPDGMRVAIVNQLQIMPRDLPGRFVVAGAAILPGGRLRIFGEGLSAPRVDVLDADFLPVDGVRARIQAIEQSCCEIDLVVPPSLSAIPRRLHLRIAQGGNELVLIEPPALRRALDAALSRRRRHRSAPTPHGEIHNGYVAPTFS